MSWSVEWGRGWMGTWHMRSGEEFEMGEVNAHGATNKQ